MNQAVIELGSNIEPEKNILRAKKLLSEKFKIVRESKFSKTKPIGGIKQPNFLNGAILLETELELAELRNILKSIEQTLGRAKDSLKFGPRTIDLDIIVWNKKIIDPDFYARDYLRISVLEILPNLFVEKH